jgi:hypothetical protein
MSYITVISASSLPAPFPNVIEPLEDAMIVPFFHMGKEHEQEGYRRAGRRRTRGLRPRPTYFILFLFFLPPCGSSTSIRPNEINTFPGLASQAFELNSYKIPWMPTPAGPLDGGEISAHMRTRRSIAAASTRFR